LAIDVRGDPMHRTDEGATTTANHAHANIPTH
jgi:hypothetical protein